VELVIIRHAQPEWVKDGLSVDNPPLTDLGFRQADAVAREIANEQFDEILVSPLLRTRQTAEPILNTFSRALVIEPWLEEIRNPIWHGTPQEKAEAAWSAEKSKASHERWSGVEGGEAVSDFVVRINEGITGFLADRGIVRSGSDLPVWETNEKFDENKKIALICHAGTGSVSLCHMLGFPVTPWEWERLVIGHATINRISTLALGDGITFGLTQLSGNHHLEPDMRTY
jgi:2,3-bisphosphoglycerate-dependent phosphoglycerate mutase